MRSVWESASAHVEGEYRYALTRCWDEAAPAACWVMLNPSTADALHDDATIRKVVGFSSRWGCGRVVVVNLFALRSTHPAALLSHPNPVGPKNDETLARAVRSAQLVVAAWGAHPAVRKREREVRGWMPEMRCVRTTKSGFPAHPLYVPYSSQPLVYEWARGADRP